MESSRTSLASRPQASTFFSGDRLKNFCEDLFFFFLRSPELFFFGEHLRFVSLVLGLGLEHSCPWPRECLSSERLSLALASDFFCVLGLEPCVLDSTSVTGLIILTELGKSAS